MSLSSGKQRTVATIISWLNIVLQIAISIFFVPFFLKTVGDKQYGLYSFSLSIISWIDTLIVAIGASYYKFLAREKTDYGDDGESRAIGVFFKIFGLVALSILVFGVVFDVLIYCNVIKLSEYTSEETLQIAAIVLASVVSASLTSFLTVGKSYPYYKEKFIFVYSLAFIQIVLQTSLSILVLKLGYGVTFVAIAHFASLAVVSFLQFAFSRFKFGMRISLVSRTPEDKKYRKRLFREILQFTLFVLLITVVDVVNKNIDKVLLGFYNADLVATYQLSLTIPSYLISFTSIITVLFTPQVNQEYSKHCSDSLIDETFRKCSKIQTILTFLIVGGFLAVGREFVLLWLDEEHLSVFYFSSILMVLYSFTCSNALNTIIRATKNVHRKASFVYLGILALNIMISFLCLQLLPKEQAIWSCLIGTIVSYLIGQFVVMQIYDYKVTKLRTDKFFADYLIYLGFALACAVLFYVMGFAIDYDSHLLVSLLAKGVLYILLFGAFVFLKDRKFVSMFFKMLFERRKKGSETQQDQ